eukprot:GHUV01058799.1.p1 GENE.GHUV01058799.1~~GHUV01058799.1.p1  ORF type:complete len:103 (+),score=12.54 GHUV01058799.1:44-310(+)
MSAISCQSAAFLYLCSIVLPCMMTAAAPACCSKPTTRAALIFFSDSPVRILTVTGRSTCAVIPATIFASLVGLRNRAAPKPRLVASAR